MQPAEFSKELDFQRLLSRFPELLVGGQIDPDQPRRFVLVKQEQAIGHEDNEARWSIDHLFLDQNGIPTLVEVKRQSDTRLRREVIGQILDYAANCQVSWTWESIRSAFESTCADNEAQHDVVLAEFLDKDVTVDQFWSNVKTNLQAGKIRMLIVADHIPTEVRRIVEFLNRQMDPAEFLAVELRQYTAGNLRTLVPMVFGQTQEATKKQVSSSGPRWTEGRFIEALASKCSSAEVDVACALIAWMKTSGFPLIYGVGREFGSVYPLMKVQNVTINPVYLSTDGKIWFQLKSLSNKPIFDDLDMRRELLHRFAAVNNSNLTQQMLNGYGSLPYGVVARDPDGTKKLTDAFEWIAEKVRSVPQA
ncbi:hypothetical protein SAMN05216360_108143 [Methylobacterium phyllostachyos]|uniref:DUF91 domain-containing protein n=2 Tax=Methylobacterium phyllostachyos TaxID=582672 RepID=A0A1H0BEQ6_9HYPH|nr:hypothetical protein SAMN05216360_108143 [Methylobacterium phyllostachyos]